MILPFALVAILFTILIVRTVFASGGSDLNQEGVAVAFLGDLGLQFAGELVGKVNPDRIGRRCIVPAIDRFKPELFLPQVLSR